MTKDSLNTKLKRFLNRTIGSKVMTIFQFICKCYAIACNTCKVHSFFVVGLSIHNYVNSWPNHFKFSTLVVDKRTSGCRTITSSIYWNWNISVIYCRIQIKLVSVKAEWRRLPFRKKISFKSHFRSRRHDVIKLLIADISLILLTIESQVGHRDHGSPWCHIKYYVTLKVTLTFGVNGKVNLYSFLLPGSSVHNSVNSWPNFFNLLTVVVDKGTSACRGITSSLYLNWNISIIYCWIEIKLVLVKAEWRWLLFREKHYLCHFRSSKYDVIKLSIADISLIIRWIESERSW